MSFILIYNYHNNLVGYRDITHGTVVEVVWTILPALILVAIAVPSFRALYLADEILSPVVTVKCIGHQWYWSYDYDDLLEPITFESYMTATDMLEKGQLRLLDVDNSIVLPVNTLIRILTSVKLDAMPGRLNQTTVLINRLGTFYGQCSELCGTSHAFMPIRIDAVKPDQFVSWMESMLEE
ncbi:hypothetical protein BT93_L4177 [Corymbia citriodora subsp. variegata]|uniref:Cytochrome c oxidase subunit 2 n=1 Tax=Corymbia citriodora subsp. variegata TaxID=360336 RepID=A0A8T0CK89_CORYI|nr:hypothetical protein BT93_L4177 [Corymbia citriodora subsp. variegata]